MSGIRWVVSGFILWHLIALSIGALPNPQRLPPVGAARHPTDDRIAAVITPGLDAVAAAAFEVVETLWTITRPLHGAANTYLSITGLAQRWNMFSNPPTVDQYLRVRYYVGRTDLRELEEQPVWTATELVLPAHREDQVRVAQSYRDSFRDKAMAIALEDFFRRRPASLIRRDTSSTELPDDLAPIGRYFGQRFQRAYLRPNERIVRTEIWYGTVPNPKRGSPSTTPAARVAAINAYHSAPVESPRGIVDYPPYHAREKELDIQWVLEYFEEP
jgi:hypothetical protein